MRNHSIFALAIIVLLVATTAEAKYCGGDGSAGNPYRICTAENMNEIGANLADWNKHFLLVNDVNLAGFTGTEFNIIGTDNYHPFTGVFDGNNHKVLNFTWTSTGRNCIALFGYVGTGGQIKNLGMENVDVNAVGGNYVSGLVGYNQYGTITNCYSTGCVTGGDYTGGLVGVGDYYGTISNCYSTGSITATGNYVGGLVGWNNGQITMCYSTGNVTGNSEVGGLVGRNYHSSTIVSCRSIGNVTGSSEVGGLVGYNQNGTITDCYSTGIVTGTGECVGGLMGYNYGTITSCYSTGSVSGSFYVGGLVAYNSGTITNCYSTGSVSATGNYIGGLVGWNIGTVTNCYSTGSVSGSELIVGGLVGVGAHYSMITNCYSTGSVSGYGGVGGLAGLNSSGTITNCCATGTVSGDYSVGGLVGWNYDTIDKCYSTGKIIGDSNVGGLVGYNHSSGTIVTVSFWDIETSDCNTSDGGIGLPTALMQTQSTFTDAGWDFVTIWDICEGTNYPKLVWQIPIGDLVCPDGVNFIDYSFFAGHWLEDNCGGSNDCGGTDLDFSDTVDANDLKIFCNYWLEGL